MTEKQKNFIAAMTMLCLLFTGSAGLSYLLMEIHAGNYNLSDKQIAVVDVQPIEPVQSRAFAWQEQYALCALYELGCKAKRMDVEESVETQIQNFSVSELEEVYPLPEWNVEVNEETVTITHNLEGLCNIHHNIYHLGSSANDQYIAVYYGPSAVGSAAGAFLVTDVPLNRLSTEQLTALTAGEYEYRSQDDLIAMLDNFSEL